MVVELGLIVLLVLLNGVFSGTELALVSARRARLEPLAEAGNPRAAAVLQLQDDPNRLLSTVQFGITLIGTLAGAFGGASIAERLGLLLAPLPVVGLYADAVALTAVVLLITYLSLVLGELVPKRLALQMAETIALYMARPMLILSMISRPIIALLTASTEVVLRLLRRHKTEASGVTEDDIRHLIQEGTEEGSVTAHEQQLIERVFALTDASVRRIMTPRTRVVVLDADAPLRAVLPTVLESGFSRFPVYEHQPDRIIGSVHVRDFFRETAEGALEVPVRTLMRPPLYIPESHRVAVLLPTLRQARQHLAVVIDELGSFEGIVTLEDVLEELVGEIADEYDDLDERSMTHRDDRSWLIDGSLRIDRVQTALDIKALPNDAPHQFETLAGFVLALLGRIPQVGDSVTWEGWQFEVVDMDGLRIDKLLATRVTS